MTYYHRKVCCGNCKTGGCRCIEDKAGHGDICGDPNCLCHHSLKVNSGDKTDLRDKMGKF